jgi:hypothetical protein
MVEGKAVVNGPVTSGTGERWRLNAILEHRLAPVIVCGLWTLMTAADLVWVTRYGLSLPLFDEWEMVPAVTGHEPLNFAWAWAQHNEHRFVIARPLLVGLYRLAGLDFRAAVFVNVLLLAALAAGFIGLAAYVRGRTSLVDAALPLILLHFGQSENLIWSWQFVYILPTVLAGLFLIGIVRGGTVLRGTWLWVVAGVLVALPLCGGLGLIYLPGLLPWSALEAAVAFRAGRKRDGWVLGAAVLATVTITCLYFVDYHRPGVVPPAPGKMLNTCLQFLAMAFGMIDTRAWQVWGWLMVVLTAAAMVTALRELRGESRELDGPLAVPPHPQPLSGGERGEMLFPHRWSLSRRERGETYRALGILAFLAGIVMMTAAVGWGRSGYGLFGRYSTLLAPGLCAVYFVGVLYPRGWSRFIPLVLAVVVAGMAPQNMDIGIEKASNVREGMQMFQRDVRAGWPVIALANRYSSFPFALYPYREQLARWMKMLADAKAPALPVLRADPPFRVVPAAFALVKGPEGDFILKPRRLVYGVQLKYAYERMASQPAMIRLTWRTEGKSAEVHTMAFPVVHKPVENVLLFWVEATMAALAIDPDNQPYSGRIYDIELLVPVNDGH